MRDGVADEVVDEDKKGLGSESFVGEDTVTDMTKCLLHHVAAARGRFDF